MWISGHFHIHGNEQIDKLANTTTETGNMLNIDLLFEDVNSIIKNVSFKICNEYWNKSSKSRVLINFPFYPMFRRSPGSRK